MRASTKLAAGATVTALVTAGVAMAQVYIGPNALKGSGSTTIGKIFTTELSGYGKWTERIVLVGTSPAAYLGEHTIQASSVTSYTPAQAESDRADYIDSLSSSMSAELKFYYESPPTTEANTPTTWSTAMYRVDVLEGTNWDDQGLLFREYSGNSFRDFWLLESGYDAHLAGESIRLVPITSGNPDHYTDRKTFIESEYSTYASGLFVETSYTFVAD